MFINSMGWYRFTRRVLTRRPVQIILLLLTFFLIYHGFRSQFVQVHLDGATFNPVDHSFIVRREGEEVLTARLGLNFDLQGSSQACAGVDAIGESACIEWDSGQRLTMSTVSDHNAKCYNIRWEPLPGSAQSPLDCMSFGRAHWYGGSEIRRDSWTIEKEPIPMKPYLPTDIIQDRKAWGSVMERYWLSSKGVAIFVDDNVPLHVGLDRRQLCFKGQYAESPYQNPRREMPVLDYKVCVGEDVKAVHQYMSLQNWERPQGIPNERVLKYPIWSTWARYKVAVDQKKVLDFANEITHHGFLGCQIEIDDMYTPTYGDFKFDKEKFPDSIQLRKKLGSLGFKMTSWVIPFHNMDSQAFADGMEYEYFLKSQDEDVPALTKWWQGTGAILDVTNARSVKWFGQRLQRLREEGVDSFKFDAGEINWLPRGSRTAHPLPHIHHFTKMYAQTAFDLTDNNIEVRAAYKNQNLPILVRMMDKLSRWDYELGLKTLIPTALTFGLIGYPFVLPDMVGGNAYGEEGEIDATVLPEKELFIRWAQVTAFMPSVQFSIAPWQYDTQTVEITKKLMKFRENYLFPRILKLARRAVTSGEPIIRPLWWADPKDPNTYDINSEFLVGDDLLVAPVLDKGAKERKIYLPAGKWKDMLQGQKNTIYEGGRWVWEYPCQLDQVPHFERVNV